MCGTCGCGSEESGVTIRSPRDNNIHHNHDGDHSHSHDHDHGKAEVYNPAGALDEKIEQAMDNCPAACIYWDE